MSNLLDDTITTIPEAARTLLSVGSHDENSGYFCQDKIHTRSREQFCPSVLHLASIVLFTKWFGQMKCTLPANYCPLY